jgi:short-subunit dehydrogenase
MRFSHRPKEPCLVIVTARRRNDLVIVARSLEEANRLRDEVRRIMSTTATHVDFDELGADGPRRITEVDVKDIERLLVEYR